jgi:hypothetical protein
MLALILNAMVVGIIFARVAFPQFRGRTIAISNSACILRRDGTLKFVFRLMDMRTSQVHPLPQSFLSVSLTMILLKRNAHIKLHQCSFSRARKERHAHIRLHQIFKVHFQEHEMNVDPHFGVQSLRVRWVANLLVYHYVHVVMLRVDLKEAPLEITAERLP